MEKDKIESYKTLPNPENSKLKRKKSKENMDLFSSKNDTEMISLKETKKTIKKEQKQNLLQLNTSNGELEDLPIEKDIPVINSPSDDNNKINPCHYGNLKCFCFNKKKGTFLIAIGPHWPFYICLSSFINILCGIYFYGLWNLMDNKVRNIGFFIFVIQIISYNILFLINPGLPDKDLWIENYKSNELGNYRICSICKVIMRDEDEIEHCDDCNVCIIGYDHHCPWTSKCVGKNNKVLFYIFIILTFGLLLYLVFGLFFLEMEK